MSFTISIVGRSNVGKTTLFNRFAGKRKSSIVEDMLGVTRDRNEVLGEFFDIKAKFIDSSGIELINKKKDTISKQMLEQSIEGMKKADICLFVIDGLSGVLDADIAVCNLLRKYNKNTILIINKSENPDKIIIDDIYKLSIDKKVMISSEHNLGFHDLYQILLVEYKKWLEKNNNIDIENDKTIDNEHIIRISILGRPNAGKSTFINKILNENRLITSDVAGTTRDKIEIDFSYKNRDFVLIDTAGIRKKYKDGLSIEEMSVEKSFEALQYADITVLMMDITNALEKQDLLLCQKICNEGRILIICFNKWDLVDKKNENQLLEQLKSIIKKSLPQIKGITFLTCSAINDNNLTNILDISINLYNKWNYKVPSVQFNKKVELERNIPNSVINTLKIKYINQIKVRPPCFVAFSGKSEKNIKQQQIDNLKNWIYREYNFLGIPVRLSVRGKTKTT